MKKIRTAIVMGILTTSAMISMGASIPDGVAKDAEWFAKVDIKKAKTTTIGQKVMDKLSGEKAEMEFSALSEKTNCDPRKDIESVLIYGNGQPNDGVVIIRGKFDRAQLSSQIDAKAGVGHEAYLSYTIYQKDENTADNKQAVNSKKGALCLYDASTIVVADDLASIKSAIDLLDDRVEGLSDNSKFPNLAKISNDSFVLAAANVASIEKICQQASVFKGADSVVAGVEESDGKINMPVVMQTPDAETAMSIKSILDGMMALAVLNAENNPEAAKLASSIVVKQADKDIAISLSCSAEDLLAGMAKEGERLRARQCGAKAGPVE